MLRDDFESELQFAPMSECILSETAMNENFKIHKSKIISF